MKNIIENYKYNVMSIIKNFTGARNEDIEQEVYLKVWKSQAAYEEKNKFSQWINAIASNTCRDYLRSKSLKAAKDNLFEDEEAINLIKDDSKNPEKILETKERQKIILNAVNKLPKKLKEVIVLYEFEEKSYEEIAKKLNIPTGTVRSRLYNARGELKNTLVHLIGD